MKKKLIIAIVMVMLVVFALAAYRTNPKDKNGKQPWQVAMKGTEYFVKGNKKALWGLFTNSEKKSTGIDPSQNEVGKINEDYKIVEYNKNPDIRYYAITHTIKWGRFTDYLEVIKQNDVWKINQFNMDSRVFKKETKGIKAHNINPSNRE